MENLKITDFLTKEIVGPFIIVFGCILLHAILKRVLKKMFNLKIKSSSINHQIQVSIVSGVIMWMMYKKMMKK